VPRTHPEQSSEIVNLTTLLEISQALASTLDLKTALHRVLETLEGHHAVLRGAVTLLNDQSRELSIEASIGINTEGQRARYRLGEGITGRVAQSGRPVVVPQISREPLFLHRAVQRKDLRGPELSFICVPIVLNKKPMGALGVDLEFDPKRDYSGITGLLRVVASMIAQALKVHRLIELERQRLVEENVDLRQKLKERYDFSNIVGTSGPMRQAYEQVSQVARSNTTVLIRGESGTGKELIAHAIHYNSARAKKPFVKVACGALPDTLIESELFGYEKGAFTGAMGQKKGRFELAEAGTLFLDEIGEINPPTQVKLLRVLQEREFERLGGTDSLKVNVRLIAATNKDLETAITERAFREDLFYRINVFTIFVPPLRERKSDIMLLSYHWPGNVRELENTVERAVLVCDGNVIHGHHLPPTLQTAEASDTQMSLSLSEAVEQYEKDLILDALKSARGNRSKAARLLNSTERIVNYKVKKFAIDCRRFRS
jgi:Nif-specific regulatory protein